MGSNKSSFQVQKEKYPCPDTVDGVCALVREILLGGSVQRIELTVTGPVRVERMVQVEDPDLAELNLDWDGALRNTEMVEYVSEGATPYQVLVDMMHLIQKEGLHCTCWATGVGGENLIDQWLEFQDRGLPSGAMQLLGKPVRHLKSLPEETLILCGSRYQDADPSEISLAVKTAIELRRANGEASSETSDPGGPDSGERIAPASPLGLAGGELRRISWKEDQSGK